MQAVNTKSKQVVCVGGSRVWVARCCAACKLIGEVVGIGPAPGGAAGGRLLRLPVPCPSLPSHLAAQPQALHPVLPGIPAPCYVC